jgi:hypothetical protein
LRSKVLERFPPKWLPVRRKKTRQIKNQEQRSDSKKSDRALARSLGVSIQLISEVGDAAIEQLHRYQGFCAIGSIIEDPDIKDPDELDEPLQMRVKSPASRGTARGSVSGARSVLRPIPANESASRPKKIPAAPVVVESNLTSFNLTDLIRNVSPDNGFPEKRNGGPHASTVPHENSSVGVTLRTCCVR